MKTKILTGLVLGLGLGLAAQAATSMPKWIRKAANPMAVACTSSMQKAT